MSGSLLVATVLVLAGAVPPAPASEALLEGPVAPGLVLSVASGAEVADDTFRALRP